MSGEKLGGVIVGRLYHHVKSGKIYRVCMLANMEATNEHVVVYSDPLRTEQNWVRPIDEFCDGRFQLA